MADKINKNVLTQNISWGNGKNFIRVYFNISRVIQRARKKKSIAFQMSAKSERKTSFFSVRSGSSSHQQKELNKSGTWKCPSPWGHCPRCFFCSQQALRDVSASWSSSLKVEQWWLRGTLQPSGTVSHASFQLRLRVHFSSRFATFCLIFSNFFHPLMPPTITSV